MHSRTPRLMEAQPGSEWPQSQHWPLPGRHWILCRMVSPRSRRSRGSLAESMLLVEGEAVRSRRCHGVEKGDKGGSDWCLCTGVPPVHSQQAPDTIDNVFTQSMNLQYMLSQLKLL